MPRRCVLVTASRLSRGPGTATTYAKGRLVDRASRTFADMKRSFLSKPDKSSAGKIDEAIVPLCAALNRRSDVFTTSSCSGRAYLWFGDRPPAKRREAPRLSKLGETHSPCGAGGLLEAAAPLGESPGEGRTLWLRFEPLILHLCCRSWTTARSLVVAARAAGLKRTAISGPGPVLARRASYIRGWRLVVEGDERLEMPLVVGGRRAFPSNDPVLHAWLEQSVREKFERNAAKTRRLLEVVAAKRSGLTA